MTFYSEIVKMYNALFPLKKEKETFVHTLIEVEACTSMLDMGCATGTLMASVAPILDDVEGFDLDKNMVIEAKKQCSMANVAVKEGNMLDLDSLYPKKRFDLVTCFGNTLVHIKSDDLVHVFKQVKTHLSQAGVFVLQILNYDYILDQKIDTLPPIENEEVKFQRAYKIEGSRLAFITVLTDKRTGSVYPNQIFLYPIRKNQLETLLRQAGFTQFSYYRNYKKERYTGKHLPLILEVR